MNNKEHKLKKDFHKWKKEKQSSVRDELLKAMEELSNERQNTRKFKSLDINDGLTEDQHIEQQNSRLALADIDWLGFVQILITCYSLINIKRAMNMRNLETQW